MGTTRELSHLLREATDLHQQGRLDEAEVRYSRLLDGDPGHFDALNRLAIVALQRLVARSPGGRGVNPRSESLIAINSIVGRAAQPAALDEDVKVRRGFVDGEDPIEEI